MPRCRSFKLIDIMILTAAAAIGMGLMRPFWDRLRMVGMTSGGGIPWQVYAGAAQIGLTMIFLMLVVAYVWIRLFPPRPTGPDLIRQPGMLFLCLLIGLSTLLWPLSAFVPLVAPTTTIFALVLGLSWFMACRHYRSHAEPGWIEGLGRTLGVGLLVAIATS